MDATTTKGGAGRAEQPTTVGDSKDTYVPPKRSTHASFSEFLPCVRNRSVDEVRKSLKGPNAWMAAPFRPPLELQTASGIEPLRFVWDHFAELRERRKAVQEYLEDHLKEESPESSIQIIANAVWSCMLEHSDELESGYSQIESRAGGDESPNLAEKALDRDEYVGPQKRSGGRPPTAEGRRELVRKHFKRPADFKQAIKETRTGSDQEIVALIEDLDGRGVELPDHEKWRKYSSYKDVYSKRDDEAVLDWGDLCQRLRRDLSPA